jgi:hypothetical protein
MMMMIRATTIEATLYGNTQADLRLMIRACSVLPMGHCAGEERPRDHPRAKSQPLPVARW